MACYNFVYAMQMLRQSIDFAEIEHNFVPIHKWANEVEGSCHGLEVIDARLNHPTGQDFLLIILQSVAAGVLSPEEAIQRICFWLNNGKKQDQDSWIAKQYQFAWVVEEPSTPPLLSNL
jgi:hypothetical protein